MEYYGITFIGNSLFFGFFALICIRRIIGFIINKKKKYKIWIPLFIFLFFCAIIRGGSLVYFGLTLDSQNIKTQEILMSLPYMMYLFLYLFLIFHYLIYYINAHINLANDRNIFTNEIPNLTKKTRIILFIVFPIFFIVFLLMSLFALLDIIAQWTLIKMISIFNIASPAILVAYYIFLNVKFSGRPYKTPKSKEHTYIIVRICILWSATRIISGIIYIALKITDLRSLIYDELLKDGYEGKTVNIILIFIFFIFLEVFPTYFTLEHNLAKTFIKEEQMSEPLIQNNNDISNIDIIRNSEGGDSTIITTKNEQELQKNISNNNNIKIDIKDYLLKEEDIVIGEKIFERKNGLGIINKGKYKNEDVIIRVIQFDRLSRYNIEDIIKDFEKLIKLNHENIYIMIGYYISQDNKVIIVNKEFKNGSLYDYIHTKDNKLSSEEKMKIALGVINGLDYLHNNNIVHCHLNSRNILLDDELNPIIVDFGFRNLYELSNLFNKYYNKSGYSAPEILSTKGKFFRIPENINDDTKKIDIYSYGMILWELITNTVPFDVKLNEIIEYVLEEKVRPEVPDDINKKLSSFIRNCWDSEFSKRPSESEIIEFLNSNPDVFNN